MLFQPQLTMTFLIVINFFTTLFLLRIFFLSSYIDIYFLPPQFHRYIEMKIILLAIQTMSLTFTLQFVIQWIKSFLLRTIIILDWIHCVVCIGNVIVFKVSVGIVLLKLMIRGIVILRMVYSFEMVANGGRNMQLSTSLLQRKIFGCILDQNLLPGRIIRFIFRRN
jgi:hypothetical protein